MARLTRGKVILVNVPSLAHMSPRLIPGRWIPLSAFAARAALTNALEVRQ